jgi:hypothetical protein
VPIEGTASGEVTENVVSIRTDSHFGKNGLWEKLCARRGHGSGSAVRFFAIKHKERPAGKLVMLLCSYSFSEHCFIAYG